MSERELVVNYLDRARRRLVGSLMGYVEKEIYPYLPDEEARVDVRRKVLEATGAYHDGVLDMVRSVTKDPDDIVNAIAQHRLFQAIARRLDSELP